MSENNLPTIKELVSDVGVYEKADKFNFLMNQQPPQKWVKHHPYIKVDHVNEQGVKTKVPYPYIPIDKVEYLLRKIFKSYKIEVTGQGTSFNGVYVTVRVHYLDVVSGEWRFHDGIGASQIQTKKGASPADMMNINNGAISMAYPLAKTLAVKDACDHFGKLFGSDLNRKDTLSAAMDKKPMTDDEKHAKIKELSEIEGLMITEDDRLNIERILDQKEVLSYDKAIKDLKTKIPNKS